MRAENAQILQLKLRKDDDGWGCTGFGIPADEDDGHRLDSPGEAVCDERPADADPFDFALDGPVPDFFGPGRPLVTPHPFRARCAGGQWCVSTITTDGLERPIYAVRAEVATAIDGLFDALRYSPEHFPIPQPESGPVPAQDTCKAMLALIAGTLERHDARLKALEGPATPDPDPFGRVQVVRVYDDRLPRAIDIFQFRGRDEGYTEGFIKGRWYHSEALFSIAPRERCTGPFDTFEAAFDAALASVNN